MPNGDWPSVTVPLLKTGILPVTKIGYINKVMDAWLRLQSVPITTKVVS
jgi:hypothetical protein